MSAPYPPDFIATRVGACPCGGALQGIYTRLKGKRIVQQQFRCASCEKITELRGRDRKRDSR